MKKFLLNVAVILAILAVGLGITMVGRTLRSRPADAVITAEKRPVNVKVHILAGTTVEDDLVLIGTFEPWQDITLSARNLGEIGWQGIDEGDPVEAGQKLLRIDTTELLVRLAQAKSQYKLATSELERVKSMRAEGISSPQQQDRARTDFEVAETNLDAAQITVDNGLIIAKFDGLVDTLYQEEGEFVMLGTHVVRVVQVDRLKLMVGIPERDVVHFSPGDSVSVQLDAYPGEDFQGAIYRIAATAEQSTHTFKAEIEVDNADGRLRPGMIAEARFVRRSYPNSIMIPLFSLISTDTGRYAFVDDDGVALQRDLEVGFLKGTQVFVRSGLEPGDRLIVVGHRDLRNGDRIHVREVLK